jgi:hypothetical protein
MFLDSDDDDNAPCREECKANPGRCKKSALESFMGASATSNSTLPPPHPTKRIKKDEFPKIDDSELFSINEIMESCFSLQNPKVSRTPPISIFDSVPTTAAAAAAAAATTTTTTTTTTAAITANFSGSVVGVEGAARTTQPSLSLPIPRKIGEDREICVARFGKIYKRKAPSSIGYLVKACPPGYRFCKFCNDSLPLSSFYTNVKRYVCKRHHYLRVSKTLKLKRMNKPGKQYSEILWERLSCYRYHFGYDKLRYDASDIKDLIDKSQISMVISPMIIPIDPQLPMRPRNVAIVSSRAFGFAMKLFGFTCSRALFIAFVQKSNLLPPNFDVARPDDPYHDPTYIRKDYDLSRIFDEETLSQTVNEHQDRVILEELEKKDDVPWITGKPYSNAEVKKNVGLAGDVVAAGDVTCSAI